MESFVNEQEVSKITGLSVATLRNWRSMGRGPVYAKVGKSVRYQISDIKEFMEERKIKNDDLMMRK